MISKIKINKKLEWVRPYLKRVKHLVDLSALGRISVKTRFPVTVAQPYHGIIWRKGRGKFTILLTLNYQEKYKYHDDNKCYLRLKPYSKIDILMNLAHELAHITYWDHCPNRQILESRITMLFMNQLLRDGYISEEEELKTK